MMKVIGNQIETHKKKVRNGEDVHRNLLHEYELREEDPRYGLVDNGGDYDPVLGYSHELPRTLLAAASAQSFHSGAGSDLTTFALLSSSP